MLAKSIIMALAFDSLALHQPPMAELAFDSLTLHLPPMTEADTAAHTLAFRFTANAYTRITGIRPACGCTQVVYAPSAVKAGQRDSIVVRFTPKRTVRTIDEEIQIVGNDSLIATLHLLGESTASPDHRWSHLPARMGVLRLKRKQVTIGPADRVMRIACANTGTKPLTITGPHTRTEPATIPPDTEADIVIAIDEALPRTITLEGIDCPEEERKLEIRNRE